MARQKKTALLTFALRRPNLFTLDEVSSSPATVRSSIATLAGSAARVQQAARFALSRWPLR